MILISDFSEFIRQIGLVAHIDDFEHLNIRPCTLLGFFDEHRLYELISFCKKNPCFHIVTHMIDGACLNHLDLSGLYFSLGKGDQDPRLVYTPSVTKRFRL